MGWTTMFNTAYLSKKQIVEQLASEYKLEDRSVYGNEIYGVTKSSVDGRNIIAIILLQKDGIDWGWKTMDETMHPYYYNCPERILKKSEFADTSSWRQRVRQVRAEKKAQKAFVKGLTPGDKVRYGMTDSTYKILYRYNSTSYAATEIKDGVDTGKLWRLLNSKIYPLES